MARYKPAEKPLQCRNMKVTEAYLHDLAFDTGRLLQTDCGGIRDHNLLEWRGAPQSHPCAVGIIIERIQGGVPDEMVHILAFSPLASLKSNRV